MSIQSWREEPAIPPFEGDEPWKRPIASGIMNCKLQMANGKWQMANGKWQMANGKWQMSTWN